MFAKNIFEATETLLTLGALLFILQVYVTNPHTQFKQAGTKQPSKGEYHEIFAILSTKDPG
jgi:hypothetical protein